MGIGLEMVHNNQNGNGRMNGIQSSETPYTPDGVVNGNGQLSDYMSKAQKKAMGATANGVPVIEEKDDYMSQAQREELAKQKGMKHLDRMTKRRMFMTMNTMMKKTKTKKK